MNRSFRFPGPPRKAAALLAIAVSASLLAAVDALALHCAAGPASDARLAAYVVAQPNAEPARRPY